MRLPPVLPGNERSGRFQTLLSIPKMRPVDKRGRKHAGQAAGKPGNASSGIGNQTSSVENKKEHEQP